MRQVSVASFDFFIIFRSQNCWQLCPKKYIYICLVNLVIQRFSLGIQIFGNNFSKWFLFLYSVVCELKFTNIFSNGISFMALGLTFYSIKMWVYMFFVKHFDCCFWVRNLFLNSLLYWVFEIQIMIFCPVWASVWLVS